jgi:hypothetical protein
MYEVKYKYNTVKLRIPDILPKGQYTCHEVIAMNNTKKHNIWDKR